MKKERSEHNSIVHSRERERSKSRKGIFTSLGQKATTISPIPHLHSQPNHQPFPKDQLNLYKPSQHYQWPSSSPAPPLQYHPQNDEDLSAISLISFKQIDEHAIQKKAYSQKEVQALVVELTRESVKQLEETIGRQDKEIQGYQRMIQRLESRHGKALCDVDVYMAQVESLKQIVHRDKETINNLISENNRLAQCKAPISPSCTQRELKQITTRMCKLQSQFQKQQQATKGKLKSTINKLQNRQNCLTARHQLIIQLLEQLHSIALKISLPQQASTTHNHTFTQFSTFKEEVKIDNKRIRQFMGVVAQKGIQVQIDRTGYLKFARDGMYIFDRDGEAFKFSDQQLDSLVQQRHIVITESL